MELRLIWEKLGNIKNRRKKTKQEIYWKEFDPIDSVEDLTLWVWTV